MSHTGETAPSLLSKRELLAALLRQRATEAKLAPLSYGQKALWFLYQTARDSCAYNTAFTARITSAIDTGALRQACQNLLARHDSLRSTFSVRGGEVLRDVHEHQEVRFEQKDVSHCSPEELNRVVAEDYRVPFDLGQGPIMRVSLFTRSAEEHVLLIAVHHIVCDAWSFWLMADELKLMYSAAVRGKEAALAPNDQRYSDFVRWQNDLLGDSAGDRLRDYWLTQLGEELPVLTLPTDRPRPPIRTLNGDSFSFELPYDLVKSLGALAEREGVTPYVLLLTAFQALLYRYSSQEEFTIGSLTSGRAQPEFAGVVGYFVNPVVIRASLSGNPGFSTLLKQVRETALGALAHQDYPFPLLVEQLGAVHDRSRTRLMDVLFVFQKRQSPAVVEGTEDLLQLAPFDLPQMEGQFDLTLEITDGGKSVLKYDTDLFERETVARMAMHFQILLEGIVADPSQQISELPLLSNHEQQLFRTWNSTVARYPLDCCLHELFEAQAERTPDSVAVVFEDRSLTYGALDEYANALAWRLQESGVGPEKLVGVCLERSFEMVVALLATLKAGGAYVPFDPSYPEKRLAFMIRDSGVQVVLTNEKLRASMSGDTTYVVMDLSAPPEVTKARTVSGVSAGNLAYVIYTSGSTGEPKGAMNTHRGICNRLHWMQAEYRLTPEDRILQKTPFSFDVSVWEFFWPLITGACLVMARPGGHQDCAYLMETIRSHSITVLHFVPSMLQAFLEQPGLEACGSLKQIFCSGEVLPVELQNRCQRRLDAELHNLYGPTEAAVDVTYWRCEPDTQRRSVPIGYPISNTQIYVLDRNLHPLPVGVSGELHIGGMNVGRGYLNRPDLTAERFIPDPFSEQPGARLYKTGDLARFLPNGAIEYVGRMDHQIKIRGFRIELPEIESALRKHPDVREAVVVAREDQPGDKILAAWFVPTNGSATTQRDLRRFLLNNLPEYMVPATFVEVDQLPLTPSGKIDRRRLPSLPPVQPNGESEYAVPETETESVVADIWQKVLRVERVGIHDNFFDLGGHSLRMTQMIALLAERVGRNVSMVEAFQYPTVHSLAQFLSGNANGQVEHGPDRAQLRTSRKLQVEDMRAARQKYRTAGEP